MPSIASLSRELETVRQTLHDTVLWTPRDFIRRPSTFLHADKKLYAEMMTRPMDEQDDLRFVWRNSQMELAVIAERLPWDSEFFGYGVAKLIGVFSLKDPYSDFTADYREPLRHLLQLAQERNIRYLFAAVYREDLATIRALGLLGFSLIETRVYYHMSLKDYAYPSRFKIRAAMPADVESLGHTAQIMVNAYDRFHADPLISAKDANRLMSKWVEASILEGFADITIVEDSSTPKAFCTVNYHRDKWSQWGLKLSQPIFSAVSQESQGWYLKIISEINYHLKDHIGSEHSFLATQITNRAVIRVWEKLGYTYGRGEHIFRSVI